MTHTTRAAILAEACRWQADKPGPRAFNAQSRSWGVSLDMEAEMANGRALVELCFWESTPDAELTPEAIRARIAAAWREAMT